jgi:hypothetical protein
VAAARRDKGAGKPRLNGELGQQRCLIDFPAAPMDKLGGAINHCKNSAILKVTDLCKVENAIFRTSLAPTRRFPWENTISSGVNRKE